MIIQEQATGEQIKTEKCLTLQAIYNTRHIFEDIMPLTT